MTTPSKNFFDATIYGGSFDPVQEGHLLVVETLFREVSTQPDGLLVIATTARNPWKTTRELTALELRLTMWQLALTAAGIPWSRTPKAGHVFLADFEYEYSAEFICWWRENFSGPHRWVTSTDSAGEEAKWRDWPALNVEMRVMEIVHNVHATDVREGNHPPLPAIRQFIREQGLYPKAKW